MSVIYFYNRILKNEILKNNSFLTFCLSIVSLFQYDCLVAQEIKFPTPFQIKTYNVNELDSIFELTSNALSLDSKNEAALEIRSMIFQKTHNLDSAEQLAHKIIEINPLNQTGHYLLGSIYFQRMNFEKSNYFVRQAYDIDTTNIDVLHLIYILNEFSNSRVDDKNLDNCTILYKLLEQKDSNEYFLAQALICLIKDGHTENYKGLYRYLLKSKPNVRSNVFANVTGGYADNKEYLKAIDFVFDNLIFYPEKASNKADRMYSSFVNNIILSIELFYPPESRIEKLDELIRIDKNPMYYQARSNAYFLSDQFEKALSDINLYYQLKNEKNSFIQRARIYNKLNDTINCIADYEKSLTKHSEISDFVEFSRMLYDFNLFHKRDSIIDFAIKIPLNKNDVINSANYWNLALLYRWKDKPKETTENYKNAIRLYEEDTWNNNSYDLSRINWDLGTYYEDKNKWKNAFFHYNQSILYDTCNSKALLTNASLKLKRKKVSEAIQLANSALLCDSTNVDACQILGKAYLFNSKTKDLEASSLYLTKALNLDVNNSLTHYLLYVQYLEQGNYQLVIHHLSELVRLEPFELHFQQDLEFYKKNFELNTN